MLWTVGFAVLVAFMLSELLQGLNYAEVFAHELLVPTGLHAVTAAGIALFAVLIRRPAGIGPKLVVVLLLALCMVNYDARLVAVAEVFKAVLPILPAGPNDMVVVSLLFLAVLGLLAAWAGRLVEKAGERRAWLRGTNLVGGLLIVTGFLFGGQALAAIGVLSQTTPPSKHVPTAELEEAKKQTRAATDGERPDIYYIVMDRYTNNTVLKEQFGFDNTPFLDSLRQMGFAVDDAALTQYPYTAASTAATLNLSYHNDDLAPYTQYDKQGAMVFHSMNRQAEAVKLLKEQGYEYYNIGSNYGASNKAPLATHDFACDRMLTVLGRKKCLRGMEHVQFERTPFYRLAMARFSGNPLHLESTDPVSYTRMQLNHLKGLAESERQGGRFIFSHILVPHEPFYLNADGSVATHPTANTDNKSIKEKYLAQLQFLNTQMGEIVREINERSGGRAVVMLISDEGPYPQLYNQTFLEPVREERSSDIMAHVPVEEWKREDAHMKYSILEAVHIPKATEEDLAHMTPINSFRIVLNRYFGYTFPYLPDCQMGMPDGRKHLYVYNDASEYIRGAKGDPACSQYISR